MPHNFRQAYEALADFIAAHPEIEIGKSVTSIPEEVRPDFYALFNAARKAFVEDRFAECLARARALQAEYGKALAEAAGWMCLEEVPFVNRCKRFLCDTNDCLTRELFDPLFDLLKQKESHGSFEEKACLGIEALFPVVYRGGYERWAVLSLTKLLEVQKAFRVPVRDLQPGDRPKSASIAPSEEVPHPVESTTFLFSQSTKAIFSVPDFIVLSGKLNRFVGIRSEFREGYYNALAVSPEREWQLLDHELLAMLESGLTLIYASGNLRDIALVGDVARLCKPDLVLWCVDAGTTSRKAALDAMALADARLKPTRGSFLIANSPWTGPDTATSAQCEESPRIRILTVELDPSRLMPVVDALRDSV